MDSDDDGNYGYDIPEDGGGSSGFRISGSNKKQSSHLLGGDNYSSGDDDKDMNDNNGSSDDGDGDDNNNTNFSYGAYAANKRRKRERQSQSTDKERNLYGVFYEDDSDDDAGPGGRGGGGGRKYSNSKSKSRHFDKKSNRMAGLSFVKAGAAEEKDKKEEVDDAKEKSDGGDKHDNTNGAKAKSGSEGQRKDSNEPGWLKYTSRAHVKSSTAQKSGTDEAEEKRDKSSKKENGTPDDDDNGDGDENDAIDEAEMKLIDDQENRFKELLAKAETSKNPLALSSFDSTAMTDMRKTKHHHHQQQQQPMPDENMNVERNIMPGGNGGGGIGIGSHGIGFGNDNRADEEHTISGERGAAQSSGLGFVSGGGSGSSAENKPFTSQAAGTGGLGLGMASNDSSSSGLGHKSSGMAFESQRETMGSMPQNQGLGLGMGRASGMGMGFGSGSGSNNVNQGLGMMEGTASGMGMGMGSGSNFPGFSQGGLGSTSYPPPAKKKDPNLGKWEKHTKGIGMKLLQKMGYEGSGGLGAKRRRAATADGGAAVGSSAAGANENNHKHDNSEFPSFNGNNTASASTTMAPQKEEGGPIQKGISRPVEVVVRPHGLGLGFGNFKEQSQLKVNRQIEAEVRGLPLPEEDSKKKKKGGDGDGDGKKGLFDGIDKSLLPSTESLLNRGANSWRKGNNKNKTKKKRKIVNYQDILDKSTAEDGSNKMKIIDMRGAPSSVPMDATAGTSDPSSSPTPVLIGEELLHNVTLLLNTHEGQLRTSSYMVKSTERKMAGLQVESKEMAQRKEGVRNRVSKMKLALDVIGEAEELMDELSSMQKSKRKSSKDKLDFALDSLQSIFVNLYSNFSREERKSLKFDTTMIPSIIEPILESLTSTLNPLKMDLSWMNHLSAGIQKLCDTVGSDNEAYVLRETIFTQSIVPWIQRSLSSSKWDPVVDVEIGLRLYEILLNSVDKSFPGAEEEEDVFLKDMIADEVVRKTVMPKLLRSVSHWRPKFDDDDTQQQQQQQQLVNPLHLWILPWLPHVNNDSTLGTLLGEVRRNLKKTLSFLSKKSVSDNVAFVRSCILTLSPWKRLFEDAAMFELTYNSVTPRFARSLARVKINIVPATQNWEQLHVLFEYFEKGLMSGDDTVSLIEGEVLPAWANALHCALTQKDHDMNNIKEFYLAWKVQLFGQSTSVHNKTRSPQLILRSDALVCRYFFGGLKMIQAAHESNETILDSLVPPLPADCNYRISLLHRSKERKFQNDQQSSAVNVRSRPKVHRNSRMEASFQEVVEAFANQHDITFHPKTGSNSMKDGKPVFLFGEHPVYFDKNVLFTLRGTAWRPISLEHLAQAC